jgi:hypothetical protein
MVPRCKCGIALRGDRALLSGICSLCRHDDRKHEQTRKDKQDRVDEGKARRKGDLTSWNRYQGEGR